MAPLLMEQKRPNGNTVDNMRNIFIGGLKAQILNAFAGLQFPENDVSANVLKT
jgi:hypothetical protein